MKGFVFAAGLGTRLKPITDTLPKALVPVGGKPLLEHVLRKMHSAGIDEVVVNVHHFAGKIEDWLADQDWISAGETEKSDACMCVQVSDERTELLETGGAVLHAKQYLEGCGSFLIHNVDILSDCDFDWLASKVRPDALATLLVSNRKSSRYLLFNPKTMRLVGWTNENTGEIRPAGLDVKNADYLKLAFSGIHIMSDKVPGLMEKFVLDKRLCPPRFSVIEFYLEMCTVHGIYGVCSENLKLLDVGKLDSLAEAEDFLMAQ